MNVLLIILIIITAEFITGLLLNYLNSNYRIKLSGDLAHIYNEDEYNRSLAYERVNTKLDNIKSVFSFVITIAVLISGLLGTLDSYTTSYSNDLVISSLLFFGIIFFISDLINLPFSIYKTFVIEERFGFNRTTVRVFILDKIKGYLLAIFLGGSLMALFVMFYQLAGNRFWIYVWIMFTAVTVLASMFYASLLLPLFNKLSPLQAGGLRSAIEEYCHAVKFRLDNLFIMDGSKRSSKANAFFSGLGAKKKIVLFDTLVEKHSESELVAILAHEVGHYRKKHSRTSVIASVLQTGLMLYLLSFMIDQPSIAIALGGNGASFTLGLLGFSMLYTPLSTLLGIGMNMLSRKNEFEADAFAATTYQAQALKDALINLSKNHLSNLTPHPAYVFFYFSHPPLSQRLDALNRFIPDSGLH